MEFVLLEWYAPRTTLDDAAVLLEELCRIALGTQGIERVTCREAFARHAGVDPSTASIDQWRAAGARAGLALPEHHADSPDDWFELLLAEAVAPQLGRGRPTMLEAWPVSQAAFARVADDARVARRFELFVEGVELANGWEEETCREILLERIAAANRTRVANGRGPLPVPQKLVDAHGAAMPDGIGAALGFDRLVMLAARATSIDAVRCFTSRNA